MAGCNEKELEASHNYKPILPTTHGAVGVEIVLNQICSGADSSRMVKLKSPFYRDAQGHLYLKTIAQREVKNIDTLVDVICFNGDIPQFIDVPTFTALDGWYAKDINHIYFFRPYSDGEHLTLVKDADSKSFHIPKGEYLNGEDAQHVFCNGELLKGFIAGKTTYSKDNQGLTVKLRCGRLVKSIE